MQLDWRSHLLFPQHSVFIMSLQQKVNGVAETGHGRATLRGLRSTKPWVNDSLGKAAERSWELAVTVRARDAERDQKLCV